MDSVGPGSVLAGRYHAQKRLRVGPLSSVWQGLDETLERPVSLTVVQAGHPRSADVVDAARRAAGVEDPRLQRVFDVGVEDGLTYVVYEWISADTLTELLRGGLPAPEEVRRLVGEAATALESARGRGLHHLALTPDSLLRGHDGPVTVSGLAVDAVLAGTEVGDPDEASRRDAHALVALLYAGLTARWPLQPVHGLEPPPRLGTGIPAPAELTAGVPADLNALCLDTLRAGAGPVDPGRLATQLAPWPSHPVASPNRTAGSFPISLMSDTGTQTAVLPAVGEVRSVQAAVNAPRPPAPPAPPVHQPATHVPAPASSGFAPPMLPAPADASARPSGTWPPIPAVKPTAAGPAPAAAPTGTPATRAVPVTTPVEAPVAAAAPVSAPAPAGPPSRLFAEPPDAEPPAPLLPSAPMSRPPAAQTRAVLLVMVGFVLILCLLAYFGLRSLGSSGGGTPTGPSTPRASSSSTASATGSGSSTAPATGALLRISKASGFDPQGDGSEKDNLAKLAYDSKTSTGWTSDTYKSPAWGGLKKGLGLLVDLGGDKTVHSAALTIGGQGAKITVYALTSKDTLTGATVLARKSGAEGTFTLTFAKPATTRYVAIWFSTPGKFNDGYRAEVDDVRLR